MTNTAITWDDETKGHKEIDLDEIIEEQTPALAVNSIMEQTPSLIQNAHNNLLYQTNNSIHLNVATGGDYLKNLNGVDASGATITLSDEWSINGKYSFKAVWDDTNPNTFIRFLVTQSYRLPVTPGDEVFFQINYKSTASFRQNIYWRKEDGSSINNTAVVIPAAPNGNISGTIGIAPPEAAYMYFVLHNTATPVANTIYVDNIRISSPNLIQKQINTSIATQVPGMVLDVLSVVYPVGAIYISVNNTNPSILFGGTWEQLKDKFLLSAGDNYTAGSTGGEATHTLIESEMPKHKHSVETSSSGSGTSGESSPSTNSNTHSHTINRKQIYNISTGTTHTLPFATGKDTPIPTNSDTHSHTVDSHSHTTPDHTHTLTESEKGSDNAHNNLPPYLVAYVWKRTG